MIAEVKLWDMLVGTLSLNNDRRTSAFRFDPGFLQKGLDIAPIQIVHAVAQRHCTHELQQS